MIEESIPVGLLPEGLVTDGMHIWVANSGESTVSKINIMTNTVEFIEVGKGPQNLAKQHDEIYVSRTYYDKAWNAFHGASKIGETVVVKDYNMGGACGGAS